jgi:tryptophanyl-tRNA synthetase
MNNKFSNLFTPPAAEKEQIAFANQQERLRIRDLANPKKKMSKSDDSDQGSDLPWRHPRRCGQEDYECNNR